MSTAVAAGSGASKAGYNRLMLISAGLGGLVYGIDLGIIGGAVPYLEATSGLTAGQLSFIVAGVLLGNVLSILFAGALADWMGRRALMIVGALLFVISIPIIALAPGFDTLILGRLLQGASAGLIGVVIPLYLAECLGAANRGRGTGVFQWLNTFGILVAAVIGLYYSYRVEAVAQAGDPEQLHAFKDIAWRRIFWVSLPPGILFALSSLFVAESPRWLYRRGRKEEARRALLRSRPDEQAEVELREMEQILAAERAKVSVGGGKHPDSLLHRKYVIPFVLACIICACNQATGAGSIIVYNSTILLQGGLSDVQSHWGYVIFTLVNFLATIGGIVLIDRRGRKFLLSLGTGGVIASLVIIGLIFRRTETHRVDCRDAVQVMVQADQTATVAFDAREADRLLAAAGHTGRFAGRVTTLQIVYSYGDFSAATRAVRSDDLAAKPLEMTRESCVPANDVTAFFSNPFASLEKSRTAPLKIENALIMPVPGEQNGWVAAIFVFIYMAFFAVGPGPCVWLALSELMPTRIRSNGMSIALLLNQAVSTAIAAFFLPTVGKHGYSTAFFAFAAMTVIYFVTATFFLPETKGKTLEEIEAAFEKGAKRS